MHDAGRAGTALDRAHPLLLGERLADQHELVGNPSLWGLGRDRHRLGHREDRVGPADAPVLDELAGRRQVQRVSFATALIDPGQEQGAVGVGQAACVAESAMSGIGVPRRHAALRHRLADGGRPGTGILISKQWEGSRLAGAVAFLAVLLQEPGNLLAIRDPGAADLADLREGAGDETAHGLGQRPGDLSS